MTNVSIKRGIAILFVLLLFLGFIRSGAVTSIGSLFQYMEQDIKDLEEEAETVENIGKAFTSRIWNRWNLIDLSGSMTGLLDMKGFYSSRGIYITDDDYLVSAYPYTTTDYEYEQLVDFYAFLQENGIHFLYVNKPMKYTDDSVIRESFGVDSFSNRNVDTLMARLRETGIPVLDLRDNIREEGLNVEDLFYRTDHHWTTRAGLWGTKHIAEALNAECGYHIDTSIYDEDHFLFTEWKNCWLGEQGRVVGETCVGLDDFTVIRPNYATSFTFKATNGFYNGTFDDFILDDTYNTDTSVYESSSWHYSYQKIDNTNNNVEYGKILLLGDSFDQVTVPFLSLGVHEVTPIMLRSKDDDFDLRSYIVERGFDTVIVCYSQIMVGAHDNPSSANYRMFTLE